MLLGHKHCDTVAANLTPVTVMPLVGDLFSMYFEAILSEAYLSGSKVLELSRPAAYNGESQQAASLQCGQAGGPG